MVRRSRLFALITSRRHDRRERYCCQQGCNDQYHQHTNQCIQGMLRAGMVNSSRVRPVKIAGSASPPPINNESHNTTDQTMLARSHSALWCAKIGSKQIMTPMGTSRATIACTESRDRLFVIGHIDVGTTFIVTTGHQKRQTSRRCSCHATSR